MRTCRPTRTNRIRRSAINRRGNLLLVPSAKAASSTLSRCSTGVPLLIGRVVRGVVGGCRTVVHRGSVALEGGFFGGVVLRAPAPSFHDRGHQDVGVVGFGGRQVVPDKPGFAVVVQDVNAEPVCFGCLDPGGVEDLADNGGSVGAVLGQGLS
ncbi:MAG: hypothetical protein QOE58_1915 [Actinomycetota bacterium]|nr:hypothetical protein [Actinomycetota bacterium]